MVFRIVGGHTDSPNLRVKQHPDRISAGVAMVALEPYGGAWLNSWLDRDLGLSGCLAYRSGDGVARTLVHVTEPVLRVPQLAIHLSEDRKGVSPDPQRHVNGIGPNHSAPGVLAWVAEYAGIDPDSLLGWELMTHDVAPSAVIGADENLLSAPRLDNQGTCYAGVAGASRRGVVERTPRVAPSTTKRSAAAPSAALHRTSWRRSANGSC